MTISGARHWKEDGDLLSLDAVKDSIRPGDLPEKKKIHHSTVPPPQAEACCGVGAGSGYTPWCHLACGKWAS